MKRVYFIDLDGVLVKQGTHELLPGALERLQELAKQGEIWYFSSWAFTAPDQNFLRTLPGVPCAGMIRKPLADEYVYIDDKLDVQACRTSLT